MKDEVNGSGLLTLLQKYCDQNSIQFTAFVGRVANHFSIVCVCDGGKQFPRCFELFRPNQCDFQVDGERRHCLSSDLVHVGPVVR